MVGILQGIGAPELIIVLVILLLLFGAKRLPEMARSVGKSAREFKKGMSEIASGTDEDEEKASTAKAEDTSSSNAGDGSVTDRKPQEKLAAE